MKQYRIILTLILALFLSPTVVQGQAVKCKTCGKAISQCPYKGKHPTSPPPTPAKKCKTCGKTISACKYKGKHPTQTPEKKCKECGEVISKCEYKGKHPKAEPVVEDTVAVQQPSAEDIAKAKEYYAKGDDFYYGANGEKQDYKLAAENYRKAAELGNAEAQNDLAHMYYNGHGVTQSYTEAAKWTRMAADQENAQAQYNLGNLYRDGQGVEKNPREAAKWYRLAIKNGNQKAKENLNKMGYEE